MPHKFALFFTLGSSLCISAFSYLKGHTAFVAHLMTKGRMPFSAAYVASLFTTLYSSLVLGSFILVNIVIVIFSHFSMFSTLDPFVRGGAISCVDVLFGELHPGWGLGVERAVRHVWERGQAVLQEQRAEGIRTAAHIGGKFLLCSTIFCAITSCPRSALNVLLSLSSFTPLFPHVHEPQGAQGLCAFI